MVDVSTRAQTDNKQETSLETSTYLKHMLRLRANTVFDAQDLESASNQMPLVV